MSTLYDSDDDFDIHVSRRHSPPPAVRYVQSPPVRGAQYGAGPSYLGSEQRTTVIARPHSRTRSPPRESPRDSRGALAPVAPPAPAPAPIIINNRIYNEHSSEEDSSDDGFRRSRRHVVYRNSRSRSRSRSTSRSPHGPRSPRLTREEWEAEQARRQLEDMRIKDAREKEERRREKEYRDEAELRHAQRQLDSIKKREAEAEVEKRIKKELELKRLKEEEEAAEEKRRRDKESHDAVERYKKAEAERIAHEARVKEQNDKEYKRRLHDDLLKSGLDEKAIEAILSNKKVPHTAPAPAPLPPPEHPVERPTYTRMARKYVSIETLRAFSIDFDYDTNPEYVLIKRWVPEWEQDQFWQHTKVIREKRTKTLVVEDKRHHHGDVEIEWVRKKHDRKRSKSPALLMYLAGARPS
ncbi:hypothetical protein TARUN_6208 [Trichoderma arundinaceum]|uniref:DUF8035 domain-containing protein n=1 Tax=Trichoderma arundinaceum TaxID=490622 RepID=A0A395NIU7_TRIAR|nr:hypothetical protein TARUN_6208 [Trichoderma arundinaceum]